MIGRKRDHEGPGVAPSETLRKQAVNEAAPVP
jgi:hypothetical protein